MQWQSFGHIHAKKILETQLQSQVFPHAYLFFGPAQVGKRTIAQEFARAIRGSTAEFDPDSTTVNVSADFGVESMRDLIASLHYKPMSGAYKVVIVDNCQDMNVQSANALLKTLEEPTGSTILILISSSRQLPKTIFSRCQVLYFSRASQGLMQEFAVQRGMAANDVLIAASNGAFGRLVVLSQSPEKFKQSLAYEEQLQHMVNSALGDRLLQLKALADLETSEIVEMFDAWKAMALRKATSNTQWLAWLEKIYGAQQQLATTIQTKFILEGLLIDLPTA